MPQSYLVTAALMSLVGCASLPGSGSDSGSIDPAEITVEVENRNFSDATIYAIDGELRRRLGRITGKTSKSFTFRWNLEQLRMLVDFTGGRSVLSDQRMIIPGAADNLLLLIGVSQSGLVTLTTRR